MCKKLSEEDLAENERWVNSLTEAELDAGIIYLTQLGYCRCPDCEA